MACANCNGNTQDSDWGAWCDPCGGVCFKPGQVFFRHVATVDGAGGRFPIVFDISTADYAYMLKAEAAPSSKRDMDGFRKPRRQVAHGTLDAMIALSYPDAKGDGPDDPELSMAPTSTPEERKLMEA